MRIEVLGRPRPKGSMRPLGKGRMKEQVEGSGDWRDNVRECAKRAKKEYEKDYQTGDLGFIYPRPQPVRVQVRFYFDPPKKHDPYPATRSCGDIDKLQRNVFDALVDAGVLQDDAQIVNVYAEKQYCSGRTELHVPGAVIYIVRVTG